MPSGGGDGGNTAGGGGSADGGSDRPGLLAAGFLSALQRLCSQAGDADPSGSHEGHEMLPAGGGQLQEQLQTCASTASPGAPPPLLLERQPAAAATYLSRLGQRCWGWQEGGTGDVHAAQALLQALVAPSPAVPGSGAGASAAATAAVAATQKGKRVGGSAARTVVVTPAEAGFGALGCALLTVAGVVGITMEGEEVEEI